MASGAVLQVIQLFATVLDFKPDCVALTDKLDVTLCPVGVIR